MPLTTLDWHNRFSIQAQWTRALRLYFFNLLKSVPLKYILDIGCGTGALLPDLQSLTAANIIGADINLENLLHAKRTCPDCDLSSADVHQLPFEDNSFDLVLCHYFLLWTGHPVSALEEMRRITKNNGYVVAFAEPDYGGRIDYPPEFINIREYQITSLLNAGADPRMGRKLKSLFAPNEFSDPVCGVYEGTWSRDLSREEIDSEWRVLEDDLSSILSESELQVLKKYDLAAWEKGTRLIYVPTFYAWAKVNK